MKRPNVRRWLNRWLFKAALTLLDWRTGQEVVVPCWPPRPSEPRQRRRRRPLLSPNEELLEGTLEFKFPIPTGDHEARQVATEILTFHVAEACRDFARWRLGHRPQLADTSPMPTGDDVDAWLRSRKMGGFD